MRSRSRIRIKSPLVDMQRGSVALQKEIMNGPDNDSSSSPQEVKTLSVESGDTAHVMQLHSLPFIGQLLWPGGLNMPDAWRGK